MKSTASKSTAAALGSLLMTAGLCLVQAGGLQRTTRAAPYVCIAVGCSLFWLGMGSAVTERALGDAGPSSSGNSISSRTTNAT